MIPDFPIPDSGFPNSEFRMAYGESGIPHHEVLGPRGAPGRHMSGILDGCNGVGHSMSWGVSWLPSVKSGTETMGEGRRGDRWPTHETNGRAQGRKESGKRGEWSLGNKKPRRIEPTGCGDGLGIIYRCPQGLRE